ncbi:MAG TPA: ATP-binding protein, partial [Streptosporangiaceae bacterium]|nr:ATP-binding protein [Streptosporangiaceae bacterium]
HLLSALREALSNTARHAHATKVEVVVERGDDLVLRVRDNGVGLGGNTRRSGLANLTQRASQFGGTLEVRPGNPGGTDLEWRVPLRPTRGPKATE